MSMGAAIAFYTIFSLAPLLLIAIAVAGLIFGEDAARGAVVQQLGGMVGETGAQGVQSVLEAARDPEGGLVGTIVGVITLAIGKTLIGLYIGKTALASSFGAAGTFVVVIVWVYYSSLVFLLGAEFTHSYARSHGSLYRAAESESAAKGRAPGERADIPRARPAATGQPRAATRRRG
jgi:uncharacterized BrkB/YihY/UPF0761 family membrane protein